MSDKIIPFTPKVTAPETEDQSGYVFICAECNCRTWLICSDGTAECANCQYVIPADKADNVNGRWRKTLPVVDTTIEETDGGCIDVKFLGDVNLARKRVFRDITTLEKKGVATILLGVNRNGASHMWAEAETAEQRDYVIGKLQDYIDYFKSKHISETDDGA